MAQCYDCILLAFRGITIPRTSVESTYIPKRRRRAPSKGQGQAQQARTSWSREATVDDESFVMMEEVAGVA
jgi:hypothetical protein